MREFGRPARRPSEKRHEASNNEPMKPRGRNGTVEYWSDGWVSCAARGGWVVGKWTGFSHLETAFSHLFPHKSTQVVDFQHLSRLRAFLGAVKLPATDETPIKHRLRTEIKPDRSCGNREQNLDCLKREEWKSVKFFMVFHAFSRFITEIRAVITRFSRFLGWD